MKENGVETEGKMGGVEKLDVGSWQARSVVHFCSAGWYFLGMEVVVRLDVETVDMTEAVVGFVVTGFGMVGVGIGVGDVNWKGGVQGIGGSNKGGHEVDMSKVEGGKVGSRRMVVFLLMSANKSGRPLARRESATSARETAIQDW